MDPFRSDKWNCGLGTKDSHDKSNHLANHKEIFENPKIMMILQSIYRLER